MSPSAEEMMKSLRIQGVVRLAQRVRRELAQSASGANHAHLQQLVTDGLAQVQRILAAHGATLAQLPAPTRQAYQFLTNLKLDAPAPQATSTSMRSSGNVALVGLKLFWERLLDNLARATLPGEYDRLHHSIATASERIERDLQLHGLDGGQLTDTSRTIRGWLAYFRPRACFDVYVAALGRVQPIFMTALAQQSRFRSPAIMHFRSVPGLYRLRGYAGGTRVLLPTPMISFPDELFRTLVDVILAGHARQRVLAAVAGAEYQGLQAELEALGGLVERTVGLHHDLAAAFARVNARYFGGTLGRPRLTWNRTFTGRKLGHYDPLRDTVLISCSLDRAEAPEFALDFVLYHELLHKQLGVDWRGGRATAHTPEFRAAERRFERHAEAETALQQLAARS